MEVRHDSWGQENYLDTIIEHGALQSENRIFKANKLTSLTDIVIDKIHVIHAYSLINPKCDMKTTLFDAA